MNRYQDARDSPDKRIKTESDKFSMSPNARNINSQSVGPSNIRQDINASYANSFYAASHNESIRVDTREYNSKSVLQTSALGANSPLSARESELMTLDKERLHKIADLEKKLKIMLAQNESLNQIVNQMVDERNQRDKKDKESGYIAPEKIPEKVQQLEQKIQDLMQDNEILVKECIKRGSNADMVPRREYILMVQEKQTTITKLEKEIEELKERLKTLQSIKTNETICEKCKTKDDLISNLKKENVVLNETLKKEKENIAAEKELLKLEKETLKQQKGRLEEITSPACSKCNLALKKAADLQAENKTLKSKIVADKLKSSLCKKCLVTEAKLTKLENENQNLKSAMRTEGGGFLSRAGSKSFGDNTSAGPLNSLLAGSGPMCGDCTGSQEVIANLKKEIESLMKERTIVIATKETITVNNNTNTSTNTTTTINTNTNTSTSTTVNINSNNSTTISSSSNNNNATTTSTSSNTKTNANTSSSSNTSEGCGNCTFREVLVGSLASEVNRLKAEDFSKIMNEMTNKLNAEIEKLKKNDPNNPSIPQTAMKNVFENILNAELEKMNGSPTNQSNSPLNNTLKEKLQKEIEKLKIQDPNNPNIEKTAKENVLNSLMSPDVKNLTNADLQNPAKIQEVLKSVLSSVLNSSRFNVLCQICIHGCPRCKEREAEDAEIQEKLKNLEAQIEANNTAMREKENELANLKAELDANKEQQVTIQNEIQMISEEHETLKRASKLGLAGISEREQRVIDEGPSQGEVISNMVVDNNPKITAEKLFFTIRILQKATKKLRKLRLIAKERKLKAFRKSLTSEDQQIAHENFKGKFDVVFCCDCTNSMGPYIKDAKRAISYIMVEMKKGIEKVMQADLKFGFVGYRDHGRHNMNTWVTKVQDLTDAETCEKFVSGITALSGPQNDIPEAVMPGLMECANSIKWRDNTEEKVLRVVFHITDAPPHGRLYYQGRDDFPVGDPSKITIAHVAKKYWNMDISYRLIKIGKLCDLMEEDFKKNIKDFFSFKLDPGERVEYMLSEVLNNQLDIMNNSPSIKDKIYFKRPTGRSEVLRSSKAGKCYILSVIFDEYYDLFVDKNIAELPVLKSLTITSIDDDIHGVKSCYKSGKGKIVESRLRGANVDPKDFVTLDLDDDELVDEISGHLDKYGGICGITIKTSKGKTVHAGSEGEKKFESLVPKKSKLHAVGGSFRKSGFDSIYFYYSVAQ